MGLTLENRRSCAPMLAEPESSLSQESEKLCNVENAKNQQLEVSKRRL
ncbi:hypothetical protein [Shewanella sairae]|nr:hypothetical protein [Shewanella sairae]MCL1130420.1 hypothetical protein [Shewanella sairae]